MLGVSLLIVSIAMILTMQRKIEEWKTKADEYALESERLLSEKLVLEKEIRQLNSGGVTAIGLSR